MKSLDINKKRRAKVKGSYTVEISILMPIILGTIMLFIFISVYLHDIAIMEYSVVYISSNMEEIFLSELDEDEMSDGITESIREIIENGTIGNWNLNIRVEMFEERIKIIIEASTNTAQWNIGRIIDDDSIAYEIENDISIINEAKWLKSNDI